MDKEIINYSQCWEDPDILTKALKINSNDVVLSVTSGGDNTIALLLKNPKKITAIDLNKTQNHLLELKLAAAKSLNYDEFLAFLGVRNHPNRQELFKKIKQYLSSNAHSWWLNQPGSIKRGAIHSGRFEIFLKLFQKFILPLAHSKLTIAEFIETKSLKSQKEFYNQKWNTKKWRLYFRLATSQYALKYLARQSGTFKYVKMKRISDEYLERLESNLRYIPISTNYFLHYCLTGNFINSFPPYLQKKNFMAIKNYKVSQLSIITDKVFSHLESAPNNYYSKFNLSDIFEGLSDSEIFNLWEQIIRTSKNGATVIYWDNLLSRPVPTNFSDKVKRQNKLQLELAKKDKVFFYNSFSIFKIAK